MLSYHWSHVRSCSASGHLGRALEREGKALLWSDWPALPRTANCNSQSVGEAQKAGCLLLCFFCSSASSHSSRLHSPLHSTLPPRPAAAAVSLSRLVPIPCSTRLLPLLFTQLPRIPVIHTASTALFYSYPLALPTLLPSLPSFFFTSSAVFFVCHDDAHSIPLAHSKPGAATAVSLPSRCSGPGTGTDKGESTRLPPPHRGITNRTIFSPNAPYDRPLFALVLAFSRPPSSLDTSRSSLFLQGDPELVLFDLCSQC